MIEGDNDGPWTVSTLKHYFERVISDRDRALELAVIELDRRLGNLNNSYERAKEKERDFYSRQQHDDFARDINRQLDEIRSSNEIARRPQWTLLIMAIGLFVSLGSSLWYFATKPLETELAHLVQSDKSTSEILSALDKKAEERSKTNGTRIDRLYELYRDLQMQHAEVLQKMGMPDKKKGP